MKRLYSHRVKVTLNNEASLVIRRLSDLSGESMSSLISTMIEPNVQLLGDIANSLDEAKKQREELAEKSTLNLEDSLAYFDGLVQEKVEAHKASIDLKMNEDVARKSLHSALNLAPTSATNDDFHDDELLEHDAMMDLDDCPGSFHGDDLDSLPVDADGVPL